MRKKIFILSFHSKKSIKMAIKMNEKINRRKQCEVYNGKKWNYAEKFTNSVRLFIALILKSFRAIKFHNAIIKMNPSLEKADAHS